MQNYPAPDYLKKKLFKTLQNPKYSKKEFMKDSKIKASQRKSSN